MEYTCFCPRKSQPWKAHPQDSPGLNISLILDRSGSMDRAILQSEEASPPATKNREGLKERTIAFVDTGHTAKPEHP
jgi:hypothetical protein